jgi:U32 family peptidase
MKQTNKPELLAPAGNLLSAVTALDSGADAVYIGLEKFNARERADNFTVTDASKLIKYAHSNGKKIYITLNTLIKESELVEAAEMLTDISELSPDAVIVQDLGIVHMIREFFPSLTIHASTQMAIHNSAGVQIAADMGIKRVILERQVMNSELEQIIKKSNIEIEVFIQGALCCSLSGRCLFSSWLGGWSGNRGKCTQPCRRRFFSDSGNGFFFSTKDLASLETIPKLKKMGIASFKIEGRLKKPDYIKNVVSAYRMMIDAPANPPQETLAIAKGILRRVAGRQSSAGFSSEKALKELIEPNKMGVTGIYCGKVIESSYNGFTASVTKKIHTGDILRLQQYAGDDSSALAVSAITVNRKLVEKAMKGETCFIKCDRPIPENASIYKTGESYARIPAKLASLPTQGTKIDLNIKINSKGFTVETEYEIWKHPLEIVKAEKHPLSKEKVIEAFVSSNSDLLDPGKINVEITGDLFVPASIMKQIRRDFWTYIEDIFPKNALADKRRALLDNYEKHIKKLNMESKKAQQDFDQQVLAKNIKCGIDALELSDYHRKVSEVILPPFCPENKLQAVAEKIKQISINNPGVKFRITSLYAFELLKDLKNPSIIISFPFPVCNSLTICEIRIINSDCKIESVQAWTELEECEIHNLIDNSPVPIEIFTSGQVPLMVTRAKIPVSGIIHDDRGAAYFVVKDTITDITYVFSEKLLNIPPIPGTASFSTCTCYIQGNKKTTFNFNRKLL